MSKTRVYQIANELKMSNEDVIAKLKDKALPVILVFWFFDVIYYPILMFAIGACFDIGDFDLHFNKYKNKIVGI